MKNILEICQETADLVAVQKPTDLFSSSSQHDGLFLSILKDTLDSLLRYGDWQELTKEGSLITISGRQNYLISDFYRLHQRL